MTVGAVSSMPSDIFCNTVRNWVKDNVMSALPLAVKLDGLFLSHTSRNICNKRFVLTKVGQISIDLRDENTAADDTRTDGFISWMSFHDRLIGVRRNPSACNLINEQVNDYTSDVIV